MKATITLLLSLFFLNTQAQWTQVYSSPSMPSLQVEALNEDTVFVITGPSGPLVHTANGGVSWDTISFANTQMISGIQFIDQLHGFIAGSTSFPTGPTFFKTSDGGATWQGMNHSAGPPYFQTDLFFISNDTGFIADSRELLKTADGGNNFTTIPFDTGIHDIKDIRFTDRRTGFIATQLQSPFGGAIENRIYKTTDQGATWALVYSDTDMGNNSFVFAGIVKMFFVNSSFGIAVGGEGKMLKTTDGGNTWVNVPNTFHDYNITDVQFLSTTAGYICYAGKVYYTGDGMQTWQLSEDPANPYDIYCIDMLDASKGYAAGHGIFKTANGGGVTSVPEAGAKDLAINVYPNPATEQLHIDWPASIIMHGIELWDMNGRLIKSYPPLSKLKISLLSGGTYHLRFRTSEGTIFKTIVIK